MQSLEERCNQILKNMESSLNARDRVGIQDFVLLDAHTSESAFLDNLRKRFHENLIYVSQFSRIGGPCAADAAALSSSAGQHKRFIKLKMKALWDVTSCFFSADLHWDSFGIS